MKGVKREQSGLLWRLLPSKARSVVARHLTAEELAALGSGFEAYQKLSKQERRRVENSLRIEISAVRSVWPGVYGATLLCLTLALFAIVQLPIYLRLQVFSPLGIGIGGAFALYFLEPWRLRFLFRLPGPASVPAAVVGCLLLVWLIFAIGEHDSGGSARIQRLLLVPLALGALVAPLAEEILFRELLVRIAGTYTGIGHIVSILLFAVLHLPSTPEMAVLYILSGAILSVLRYATDTLSVPLAAHSMANFIVTMARFY
jgi:membrane protease YdiL (CAAX protease family)